MQNELLYFASDYQEGAHSKIMDRLLASNLEHTSGYGTDIYSESAREKIRAACQCPDADIFFLVGGTQTNATVIDACLRSYEGVLASDAGHISVHESGAIEFGGHKVLTLPHTNGKISASQIEAFAENFEQDGNHDHMVHPRMVYLSQPTEFGTLYSLAELEAIHTVCQTHGLLLYIDGARLAYGLATQQNDVDLPALARLCDAFYIGGTKCGALLGEAVVIPKHNLIPHFFTIMKQHGALLAKGRLLGIQFDTLFTDDLYLDIGKEAIRLADQIRAALSEKEYTLPIDSPTNQIFVTLPNSQLKDLSEKVAFSFWEAADSGHTVIRLATSWATTQEDVDRLLALL